MEKSEETALYYFVKSLKASALFNLDMQILKANNKKSEYLYIDVGKGQEKDYKKIICNSENRIRECLDLIFDILKNADDNLSKNNAAALYRQIVETAI